MIYGTTRMTLFTDLGNLKQSFANGKVSPDRQGRKIYPFGSDVLGKVAGGDIEPFGLHFFYALQRKQTNLPVPVSSMGITNYTVILSDQYFRNGLLSLTLLLADTNSNNFTRHRLNSVFYSILATNLGH